MIIKFEQSPEEYFRLSRSAFGQGAFDRALLYGERALRGKNSAEHKLSLAEILLAMGRYPEAADYALETLCFHRGLRTETYDLLARVSSELGQFFETLQYIAKKAQYEGDEETLDEMDEVMREFEGSGERSDGRDLYLVGEKKKPDDGAFLMRANFALGRGEYDDALVFASEVEKDSPNYIDSRVICVRAYMKKKESALALETAEEIAKLDPKNAYALYLLIDKFKKKEYIPLLSEVEGDAGALYYAILAAENAEEHAIADRLADKLLAAKPYEATEHFIAAAVALNGGNKAKSEDLLKGLFELYPNYPAKLILKGWRRLRKCEVAFEGALPDKVLAFLRNYVIKHAADEREFVHAMLTDETFRRSVELLCSEGDRVGTHWIVRSFGASNDRQVDDFFAKLLTRYSLDLLLKRAILAELLFHRDKGRLFIVSSITPKQVSCVKPPRYAAYSEDLRVAFVNLYSFASVLAADGAAKRVIELAERAQSLEGIEKEASEVIGTAFLYRMIEEGLVPSPPEYRESADICRFISSFVFGIYAPPMTRALRLAKRLEESL